MGQGYVGLVVAVEASQAGFVVVGYDPNRERIDRLKSGSSYIEDVTDEQIRSALHADFLPTDDCSDLYDFDVAIISVPTPLQAYQPDLSFVKSAARTLSTHLRPGALVVLESTTFPGTTEEVVCPILEAGSGLQAGKDFFLGYSPERIDPGNPRFGLRNTPKVVAGIDGTSLDFVERFFSTIVEDTVRASGCAEAELSKIVENTFRHVNIALVNEVSMYAHALGVDGIEAIDLASTKPFGFMPFRPGPGVGGHCLPVDPTFLSWRVQQNLGERFRFIELANDINDHMPQYVVRRIAAHLNERQLAVKGTRILVLGASYKPNVGDLRESPAIAVIQLLIEQGAAVTVFEPYVESIPNIGDASHVRSASSGEIGGADLVVLLTDHDDFDYRLIAKEAKHIFDTRHRFTEKGNEKDHGDSVTYL